MSETYLTMPERMAILETRVSHLSAQNEDIKQKLDALLAFKHKGLGALSLITAILGTSIIGAVYTVIEYFKLAH